MKFESLGLSEPILRAIAAEGYTTPTPIQIKALPHVLQGHDVLGCAQTGTGKTAAFALPILHRLSENQSHDSRSRLRSLILAPTRELASQIADSFQAYGRHVRLRHTVIFGGVNQHHQVKALKAGVDILIATPGRLLDLMNQGYVDLRGIEIFVLDEADRMLDMGFIPDIRRIVKSLPSKRQNLMFSATMPQDIRQLADSILNQPVSVAVDPIGSAVDVIAQSVYFVQRQNKTALLTHLLQVYGMSRTLVFTRTKHGADKVVKHLDRAGIKAAAIHGNKSQNNRTRALAQFKSKHPPVLVATDIASRGIDVDNITHVINFDMPDVPETYVHRIGRTARAGATGTAISFCDHEERGDLRAIERLIRRPIEVNTDQPKFSVNHAHAGANSRMNEPVEPSADRQHRSQRTQLPRDSRRRSQPQLNRSGSHAATHPAHAKQAPRRDRESTAEYAAATPRPRGYQQRGRGKPRRGV